MATTAPHSIGLRYGAPLGEGSGTENPQDLSIAFHRECSLCVLTDDYDYQEPIVELKKIRGPITSTEPAGGYRVRRVPRCDLPREQA